MHACQKVTIATPQFRPWNSPFQVSRHRSEGTLTGNSIWIDKLSFKYFKALQNLQFFKIWNGMLSLSLRPFLKGGSSTYCTDNETKLSPSTIAYLEN